MAQQVITLAKEETSQDILSRVKRLETDIALIKPTVTELRGGYPYVKTTGQVDIYPGKKTFVIMGKAKVTIWGSGVLSFIEALTLDGVSIQIPYVGVNVAPPKIEFTCETGMQFKLKSGNSSYTDAVVFAQFASSSGTLTYS